MRFISIDPSLANLGIVRGVIKDGAITLVDYKLTQTEKTKVKSMRASSDLVNRCRQLNEAVLEAITSFSPDICFVETPSGSQSYSGALSYGISCFIISLCNPPAIEVSPIEVKKLTVGSKTATKKEIINYIGEKYPGFLETKKDGSFVEGRMEHIADAVCIAEAGMKTTQFKQLSKFFNN